MEKASCLSDHQTLSEPNPEQVVWSGPWQEEPNEISRAPAELSVRPRESQAGTGKPAAGPLSLSPCLSKPEGVRVLAWQELEVNRGRPCSRKQRTSTLPAHSAARQSWFQSSLPLWHLRL